MSNLSEKIESCLARHNPDLAIRWHNNVAVGELPQVNDYLRLELGLLPFSTTEARECLVDDIAEKDWLRHFRKYVAPVIVQSGGFPAWK